MRPSTTIAAALMLGIAETAASADCGDLRTQAEMNQCAVQEYAKADRELTALYDAYRARLNEEQKRQLQDAQRAWVRFRELWCGFQSSGVKGGSVQPLVLNSCLTNVTRSRLRQLAVLAECQEGDLSCPAWK